MTRSFHIGEADQTQLHIKVQYYTSILRELAEKFTTKEAVETCRQQMLKGVDYYTKEDYGYTVQLFNGIKLALSEDDWTMWNIGVKTMPHKTLGLELFNTSLKEKQNDKRSDIQKGGEEKERISAEVLEEIRETDKLISFKMLRHA